MPRMRVGATAYILSGSARIRQGSRSVELGPASAAYFFEKIPHSIEALESEPLSYLYTYACERLSHKIDLKLAVMEDGSEVDIRNWNNADTRWAVCQHIGEVIWVEASKGFKVRARLLFDQTRGNAQEMKVGIAEIDPGVHYTLHYHDQPEIYYTISGRGVIFGSSLTPT